ncbi:MAG TPA: phosphotransferase family protein [Candidatus Limnocylindrales bacterium]|nr:phosphotransferase family protein [Candidatus Limnocylindrales bacterium]
MQPHSIEHCGSTPSARSITSHRRPGRPAHRGDDPDAGRHRSGNEPTAEANQSMQTMRPSEYKTAKDAGKEAGIDGELVDFAVLSDWMDREGLPGGQITGIRLLAGGTQNVLVRFSRGGREYVLRRPPRHLRPKSNDSLRREGRVLAALAGSDVPHPGFIAGCFDEAVMGGAVFYLMEPVDGFNATTELPALHAGDAGVRHEMGLESARALSRLSRLDPAAIGLSDFGKPQGFLERQVSRWLSELESYSRHQGYPGPRIPGIERIAAWLERNRPEQGATGILHGDYHLANVMYDPASARLVAIVDWEMSTLGDPLLDLGWLLATWPDAEDVSVGAASLYVQAGGLPRRDELVRSYAEGCSRALDSLDWYVAMACFKLGIVLEGTHARAFAGKAPVEIGDMLHAITLGLFRRADRIVAGS